MKKTSSYSSWLSFPLLAGLLIPATLWAGDDSKMSKNVEVIVAGEGHTSMAGKPHTISIKMEHDGEASMGPTTFLGVETARVSSTLATQLGLGRGMGLVIQRVVPNTPAAAVLEKHDILTMMDDQLLVGSDQLGVLIRSKEPGTEVTLTFIRGGEKQTAPVTLTERKVSKLHAMKMGSSHASPVSVSSDVQVIRKRIHDEHGSISLQEVEELIGGLKVEHGDGVVWVDGDDSPVVRMLNINQGTVVFTDEEGTVKLLSEGGQKRLVVVDTEAGVVFDGSVDTAEEREALEEAIKARLQKVESIHTMDLQMDGDFEVEDDVHVVVPHASLELGDAHVTKHLVPAGDSQ